MRGRPLRRVAFTAAIITLFVLHAALTIIHFSDRGRYVRGMGMRYLALAELQQYVVEAQYQKALLFERLLQTGEELRFGAPVASRRIYLRDHLKATHSRYRRISQHTALKILAARETAEALFAYVLASGEWQRHDVETFIGRLERAHIRYDQLMDEVYALILKDTLALSFTDLDRIQEQEREMGDALSRLMQESRRLIRRALQTARRKERQTIAWLWLGLSMTAVGGVGAVWLMIRDERSD